MGGECLRSASVLGLESRALHRGSGLCAAPVRGACGELKGNLSAVLVGLFEAMSRKSVSHLQIYMVPKHGLIISGCSDPLWTRSIERSYGISS